MFWRVVWVFGWLGRGALGAGVGEKTDLRQLFNETQHCVRSLWASSEALKDRFSLRQMAGLCKKRQDWLAASKDFRRLRDQESPFTPDQRAWLSKIHSCRSLEACIRPANASLPGARQRRQAQLLMKSLRREYRQLSDEDRRRFHDALESFKRDTIDGRSKFDLLVWYHQPEQAPAAHWGPAFLPWHREFLRQLEVGLRTYDPLVSLPYWDSSIEEGLPEPAHSLLWTQDFVGGGDGYLDSGPFKDWDTVHRVRERPRIVRSLGSSRFGSLYRPKDFEMMAEKATYGDLTSCVDPYFELVHGAVHLWVGGHMADIPISPNDPLFFLHHAFVDQLWEAWRSLRQSPDQRQSDYPPPRLSCNPQHYLHAPMLPFPETNADGLSLIYTDVFYEYGGPPRCSAEEPDGCASAYLFCDVGRGRCLAKLRLGGLCAGFEAYDACHQGVCVAGVCLSHDAALHANQVGQDLVLEEELYLSNAPPGPREERPREEGLQPGLASEYLRRIREGTDSPHSQSHENFQVLEPVHRDFGECCPCRGSLEAPVRRSEDLVDDPVQFSQIPPDDDVWLSFTVLRGNVRSDLRRPLRNAEVLVKGRNYQGASVGLLSGSDEYPFYPGAAYVKVRNPSANGGRSEAVLSVTSPGLDCGSFCLGRDGRYSPCSAVVAVDVVLNESYALPYTPYPAQVVYLGWTSKGRRPPDHHLFLCDVPAPRSRPTPPIKFSKPVVHRAAVGILHSSEETTEELIRRIASAPLAPLVRPIHRPSHPSIGPLPPLSEPEPEPEPQGPKLGPHGGVRLPTPPPKPFDFSETSFVLSKPVKRISTGGSAGSRGITGEALGTGCRFLRFEDFLLIGFATEVEEGATLAQCKESCRAAEAQRGFVCNALSFWPDDGTCILNTESRRTQPDLFLYRKDEGTLYFDFVCDSQGVIED